MSEYAELISDIRTFEMNAMHARKTNETVLPKLKLAISDIERFNFGNEDLDLKAKTVSLSEKINELEVDSITAEMLGTITSEIKYIINELSKRYRDRMESYASRQGNI